MKSPRWLNVPLAALWITAVFATALVLAPRTPAAAAEPCSVVVSGGEASLSWGSVAGVSTYVVRSQKPGASFKWLKTLGDVSSWTNPDHVAGEEYLIRYQPGPTDIPCSEGGKPPADCVALQRGIPVIPSGSNYNGIISHEDAVWPAEAAQAASGGNILYGYMWVPENWQVDVDGYHSLLHTGGTNHWARLDRQLNGTGTDGIVGYALEGTRHRVLETPNHSGFSPRGEFPTLARFPKTTDEHDGYFILVGLNIWRSGWYQYDATFEIEPRAQFPAAPFVEPPCVVYEDIVPGYGPHYSEAFWTQLGLSEATAVRLLEIWANPVEAARFGREALVYAEEVLAGCVAAVGEFFESILEAAELVEEFFRNPELFMNTKIEEIRVAVEAAVADPENAVTEILTQVLKLDLLRENPARWVGEVGCQILIDIVTGVAVAKVAERVLDFINAKRRNIGDGDPDAFDPDIEPRDLREQQNFEEDTTTIVSCENSFLAGTQVRLADNSLSSIEDLLPGDQVLSFDTLNGEFAVGIVGRQWAAIEDGLQSVEFVDGAAVISTPDHRYLSSSKGWVPADALELDDTIISVDGKSVVSSSTTVSAEPHEVWDISVGPHNNFVVSAGSNEIVVHNADCTSLTPGTAAHKDARWDAYQDRNGEWSYEHWSNVYDANMTRATRAAERSNAAAAARGLEPDAEYDASDLLPANQFPSGRRWDYVDELETTGFEHKSHDVVYNTEEVALQANKDARIQSTNADWSVVWTFDGRPSRPLWDLLNELEIDMQDAVTLNPIPRPGE